MVYGPSLICVLLSWPSSLPLFTFPTLAPLNYVQFLRHTLNLFHDVCAYVHHSISLLLSSLGWLQLMPQDSGKYYFLYKGLSGSWSLDSFSKHVLPPGLLNISNEAPHLVRIVGILVCISLKTSSPQPFRHQGAVLWKKISPRTGSGVGMILVSPTCSSPVVWPSF